MNTCLGYAVQRGIRPRAPSGLLRLGPRRRSAARHQSHFVNSCGVLQRPKAPVRAATAAAIDRPLYARGDRVTVTGRLEHHTRGKRRRALVAYRLGGRRRRRQLEAYATVDIEGDAPALTAGPTAREACKLWRANEKVTRLGRTKLGDLCRYLAGPMRTRGVVSRLGRDRGP